METKEREVDCQTGLIGGLGERRVERPTGAGAGWDEEPCQHQRDRRHQEPKADIVKAREGHVRGADHQRHEPVAEATDEGRHQGKEDHDQTVGCDHRVPGLAIGKEGAVIRPHQLPAHEEGKNTCDEAGAAREEQVEGPDVSMVCAAQPSSEEARRGVVRGAKGMFRRRGAHQLRAFQP